MGFAPVGCASRLMKGVWVMNRIRRVLALSLLLALLAAALPLASATADGEFPQEDSWARLTPSVVWCDDPSSTVTIEVHIVGRTDVRSAYVEYGAYGDKIDLYDDGTNGDAQAGDNVFTFAGAQLKCYDTYLDERGYGMWWGMLRVVLADGTVLEDNYGISGGQVDPRYKGVFQVQDFGNGLSATPYAFFIQDSGFEIFEGYPVAEIFCGKGNNEAFRKFYTVMPDEFDILLLMPGMQMLRTEDDRLPFAENVPYNVLVSNAVEHIGMRQMDNTADFGSDGRLKSIIYYSFGDLDVFDHEIGHTWGCALGGSLGLIAEGTATQGHWTEDSDIEGQMGAYYFDSSGKVGHFAYNGDDTWRLIANTDVEPYSPLELYMMGLIPAEEVPPIHLLSGPDMGDLEHITFQSVRTVTIEDILAAEGGERVPSDADSQKEFNLGFIVTQDIPYNDAAYAFFSLLAYQLMTRHEPLEWDSLAPFYWATGERATLQTRLPLDLPEPAILPDIGLPISALAQTEAAPQPTGVTPVVETAPPAEEPTPLPTGVPGICPSALAVALLLPGLVLVLRRRMG
jgi:hypothetical protein